MTAPIGAEARRLNRIRSRLMRALSCERAHQLRQAVVEVASDIEAMMAGGIVADELCPSTRRSVELPAEFRKTDPAPPPDFFEVDWDPEDSAPPVPVARPSGGP